MPHEPSSPRLYRRVGTRLAALLDRVRYPTPLSWAWNNAVQRDADAKAQLDERRERLRRYDR